MQPANSIAAIIGAFLLCMNAHAQVTECAGSGTPIPDGASSASVVINVPADPGATVADVTVSIDASHGWLGDLIITVTHGAQSAVLLDQVGEATWSFGCGGSDIDATFTDDATATADALCMPGGPTPMLSGDILPLQSLGIFDGAPIADDWTITVVDANPFDSGIINTICITITPAPGEACAGDINGDDTVDLDDFNILAINFGAGPGATPAQGDLDDDGDVDLDDFNVLAINFGANCG